MLARGRGAKVLLFVSLIPQFDPCSAFNPKIWQLNRSSATKMKRKNHIFLVSSNKLRQMYAIFMWKSTSYAGEHAGRSRVRGEHAEDKTFSRQKIIQDGCLNVRLLCNQGRFQRKNCLRYEMHDEPTWKVCICLIF